MWTTYDDSQRVDVLDRLRNAGVTTVRIDVAWAMLQPDDGASYDAWGTSFLDHVINLVNSYGITPLITLWLTPGWANDWRGLHVLPNDPADYARVAQWLAARNTNRVAGWEVWNEPNSPSFLVGADPVAYTNLLRAAYPAFHAGYPATTVVFGGLEYNDDGWLTRAYDAGAGGYFDVVGIHPYMGMANASPNIPDDGTMWTLKHVNAVRNLMIGRGDGGKSVWFTEFGWSTHSNPPGTANHNLGVTEAQQAQYFTDTITMLRSSMLWVGKAYWYAERDLPGQGITQSANYGLLRLDHTAKPIMDSIYSVTHT